MNNLDHPLNLLRGDRPRPRLLSQQVHHVSRELLAAGIVPEHRNEVDQDFILSLTFQAPRCRYS